MGLLMRLRAGLLIRLRRIGLLIRLRRTLCLGVQENKLGKNERAEGRCRQKFHEVTCT